MGPGGGSGGVEALPVAIDSQGMTTVSRLDGATATNDPTSLGRKRKSTGDGAESKHPEATGSQPGQDAKKIKLTEGHAGQGTQPLVATGGSLGPDKSLLPPEVWHHVFTFCPPKSLGRLVAASRLFNLYLDSASPVTKDAAPPSAPGVLTPVEPNAIWQASRRLFWPQMPTPLRSKTELEMWRLACSPRCQDCGKLDARGGAFSDPRHPGPGTEGVVAIWAFGSRMCATCLVRTSDKVRGLLLRRSRCLVMV
jgi:hypothetical protein